LWLAWFTWVLYLVIAIFTLLFQIKNAPSEVLSDSFNALVLLLFATVGALIASRRPQNPIGWIFCISTLMWALGVFLLEYAVYALITAPGSLPAGALMSFFGDWARAIGWLLMLTFLLLLFPNGHLPSRKWRPLAWLIAGLLAAFKFTLLLSPNQYDTRLATVHNPLGIAGATALFYLLTNLLVLCLVATILACIAAVVFRFRRARGDERQQLKWFAYGTILNILLLIPVVILLFSKVKIGDSSLILFYLSVVFIPISAAIAILKYRLYDLDVLINRTLVYSTLTAHWRSSMLASSLAYRRSCGALSARITVSLSSFLRWSFTSSSSPYVVASKALLTGVSTVVSMMWPRQWRLSAPLYAMKWIWQR
jgi:hypothetical protein